LFISQTFENFADGVEIGNWSVVYWFLFCFGSSLLVFFVSAPGFLITVQFNKFDVFNGQFWMSLSVSLTVIRQNWSSNGGG